jgi:hypothetical protein
VRTLLSALVIGGLVLARPAFGAEADPLAPLTEEDPLAPLTADPAKPKPAKPRPKPKAPPPDRPAKPPPPEKIERVEKVEKPAKPPPEKVEVVRKINAERIKVSGVPPMPLKPGQSVTLTFKVMDPNGRAIPAELSLICNIGTITAPVETAPGIFSATFAPPASGQENIATIRADVRNGVKPVFSETKIGMVLPAPTAPTKPAIVATEPTVKRPRPAKIAFADVPKVEGSDPVKVRFQVEDAQGNAIPPDGVALKAENGSFENVREESGTYVADFVPAKDGKTGDIGLYAEAGGGERLAGAGTITVSAAPTGGNFGVAAGLLVGALTNYGKVVSPQFELNVEAKIFHIIRLGVLAGYAPAFASGVSDTTQARQADFNFTLVPLMFRAAYQQGVGPIDIYAGGMIGVAIVSGTATGQNGAKASISDVPLDMAAFVGGGLTLGPGMLVLEIRASYMKIDKADDPVNPTVKVKGNLGGFSGALGYKFEF